MNLTSEQQSLLENWKEILAAEIEAVKKRPLHRKIIRLLALVDTLIEAKDAEKLEAVEKERERCAEQVEDLQKLIQRTESPQRRPITIVIQSELDGVRDRILNQDKNA